MNPPSFSRRWLAIFLVAVLAGCNFGTPAAPAGNPESTSTPGVPGDQPPASRGPGSYDLPDVETMLGALHSYRATVSQYFDGTQEGSASKWDFSYTLQASQQPPAQLLTIDSAGLVGWMIGEIDGTRYYRDGRDQVCQAELESEGDQESITNPVNNFLPKVWGAEDTGVEQSVNGLMAKQYRFDESALGLKGLGTATGELWVASDGGTLLKYTLQAEGGEDFFAAPMQGKMTWEYELNDVNASTPIEPPEGCPPGRVTAPHLSDGSNPIAVPGSLTYETGSDVAGAAAFYGQQMPLAGYQETSAYIDAEFARLQYMLGSQKTTVYIWGGSPTTVQIVLASKKSSLTATTEPAGQVTPIVTETENVTAAFSKAAAMGQEPNGLPSYHLDVHQTQPDWDKNAQKLISTDFTLSADIQGSDIHFTSSRTTNGQAAKILEGYLIGKQEYEVVEGKIQDSNTIGLEWVGWPLDAITPIGTASVGTTLKGPASIEGRPVDELTLDSATADPALLKAWLDMNFFSIAVPSARGTAWVDKQTGVLLKLVLDYEAQVLKLPEKTVLGTGSGHLEITVTQIGLVTVQLP